MIDATIFVALSIQELDLVTALPG